jgi:hypothetical protein
LPNIIKATKSKDDDMGWAFSTYKGDRNEHKMLYLEPEGKRPLGRHRCR